MRRKRQDACLTFNPDAPADPLARGFGSLEMLNEHTMPPGGCVRLYSHPAAEVITYVVEGALTQLNPTGPQCVIRSGEFQLMTVNYVLRQSMVNASRADWAHVFQVWLRPPKVKLKAGFEQKRFSVAQRRGVLCVIASRDGRKGSLRLHHDVQLYSAILATGQHLVHELAPGRIAWLHILNGEASLRDLVLTAGDGAGVAAEIAVSITALTSTEIFLLDLPACRSRPNPNAGATNNQGSQTWPRRQSCSTIVPAHRSPTGSMPSPIW